MKFENYNNKHKGERCFILGNAPSLANEKLFLLENENVFIVNKGYLAKEIGLKNYTYYSCLDERVYNSAFNDIQQLTVPKFYHYNIQNSKNYANEDFIPVKKNHGTNELINNNFPESFDQGWGNTRSVVYDTALIAFFMGFNEIYFLGVDFHHPSKDNSHFYKPQQRENKSFGAYNKRTNELQSIIKNFSSFFDNKRIEFCNLSKGFKFKNLMKTSTLENVIEEKK